MKKLLMIGICMLMLACELPNGTEPTEKTTEPTEIAAPEIRRYPVTEAITPLPKEVESVDLGDRSLVYTANDTTYLYVRGESIPLYAGAQDESWHHAYNHLTAGMAFLYLDPNDGTLHRLDLADPHKEPVAIAPELISGATRFAVSEDGNTVLFLKQEGRYEQVDKPMEALSLYADGKVTRIAESEGCVDQFYLSPDGKSMIFYVDVYEGTELTFSDFLILDGGEPFPIPGIIESISEDLHTMLTADGNSLTLYRAGQQPLLLTDYSKIANLVTVTADGTIRWLESDGTFWQYDGVQKRKLLENVSSFPCVAESGMYVYVRDGSLYAQFDGGAPLLICAKGDSGRVFLSDLRDGGKTLVYSTIRDDADASAHMHRTTYTVTVNRTGVSAPRLISDDNYMVLSFCGDWITVRTEDTITCELWYKGRFIGVVDDLWNDYHPSGDVLYFRSEGRLCRFDGETVTVLLASVPETSARCINPLGDGAFLYCDGDVLYCYDGAAFHRMAEQVTRCSFTATREDVAEERDLHD